MVSAVGAEREASAEGKTWRSALECRPGVGPEGTVLEGQTGKLVQEAERDYSVFQKGSDFQSVGKPMREVSTMG